MSPRQLGHASPPTDRHWTASTRARRRPQINNVDELDALVSTALESDKTLFVRFFLKG